MKAVVPYQNLKKEDIAMHKIWKFKESKANKVILIQDKVIYKGNPKENDLCDSKKNAVIT